MGRIPLVVAAMLLAGCEPAIYEFEGRRVVVQTDITDRVCAGTLAQLDGDVEFIEAQLGLPPTSERIEVPVVGAIEALDQCGGLYSSCAYIEHDDSVALMRAQNFDGARVHELTHARVLQAGRGGATRLFSEGIAVALAPARCARPGDPPPLDELLAAPTSSALGKHGYYLGGELVAWLLEVHGPAPVLDLMGELRGDVGRDPAAIRDRYRARFGSELDDDIVSHVRERAELTPAELGCVAPPVPREGEHLRLRASLDCDSDRVRNDFVMPERVFVEWTFELPEPSRVRLLDPVPAGTRLIITPCTCGLHPIAMRTAEVSWSETTRVGASEELWADSHVVRWYGPLDGDVSLDIGIAVLPEP